MLIGTAIADAFKQGVIKCHNYAYSDFLQQGLVNPNSLDLTLGDMFAQWNKEKKSYDIKELHNNEILELKPQESILGVTQQFIGTTIQKYKDKHVIPCIEGKSTLARNFLAVHVTAGFGDVGYTGAWTLELVNLSNDVIYLQPNMRICQIYFQLAEGDVINSYEQGSYNNDLANFDLTKVLPKYSLHKVEGMQKLQIEKELDKNLKELGKKDEFVKKKNTRKPPRPTKKED